MTRPQTTTGDDLNRTLGGRYRNAILAIEREAAVSVGAETEPRPFHWLDDIADRDAQTRLITKPADLPLGRDGTKYDHARWQASEYHLDTHSLALGDRHLLLEEVRRQRAQGEPPQALDTARSALADIMSMTVDHLDDGRLRVIHKTAQRGLSKPRPRPRHDEHSGRA